MTDKVPDSRVYSERGLGPAVPGHRLGPVGREPARPEEPRSAFSQDPTVPKHMGFRLLGCGHRTGPGHDTPLTRGLEGITDDTPKNQEVLHKTHLQPFSIKEGAAPVRTRSGCPVSGQGLSVHHTHTLRDGLHPRRSFGSEAPRHVSWELHQPPCRSCSGLTPTAPLPGRPSICVCMAPPHPPGSLPVTPRSGGAAGPPLSSGLPLPRLPSQAASPSALRTLSTAFSQNNA